MASSASSKGGSGAKNTAKSSPSAKRPNPKSKAARNIAAKAAAKSAAPAASSPAVTAGMTGVDKVVWVCLHLLVFLVPVAMSNFNWLSHFVSGGQQLPLTYDQFDIVKVFVMRACALVGLGAWSFQFFFKGGKLRRTKLDWLILGFLGWVLLTSFFSISPATAIFGKYRRFEGFFSFATYAVVYFLVIQLVDRTSRIRSIARTFMFSSFIVAGYGVLQYVGWDPINWGTNLPFEANRAFSTFGNPDLLGGFLVFPLAISMALALSEKKTGWRIFYWSTFLITVAAWIVAFVRGAWIGGAVAIVIVIVAAILARTKLGTVDWSFAGVTGLAGIVLVVRSLTSSSQVMNVVARLQSILQFDEGSALTRFEIWQAAIGAIKARPLFGFGADTFRLVFPLYKPLSYTRDAGYLSVADNVHDYPLQLMAGIGIIGFLLLYGLFGWALWLGAPDAFSRGKGTERLVIAGFWAAAVGYILHLFTGLSVTGSTVFLWVAMAIIVSPTAREEHHDAPAWGAIAGTAIIAVLAIASLGNVLYIVADNYFLQGQFPMTGQDPVALTQTAITLSPYNDTYRSMLGKIYEGEMTAAVQQASTDQAAGKDPTADMTQAKADFTLAEDTYANTIKLVPTEYDNYLFISALYNEAGNYFSDPSYYAQAIAWADKGIADEPFGPGVRLQKAVAQASTGDLNGALATIQAAAPMDPNYSDPYLFEAQLLTQMGRYSEAATQYEHLLSLQTTQTAWATALKAVEASAAAVASGTAKP